MPRRPDIEKAKADLKADALKRGGRKLEADGLPHSDPTTIDQDLEDSFPASDPPSYTGSQKVGTPKKDKKSELPETEPGGLAAAAGTTGKKVDNSADSAASKH